MGHAMPEMSLLYTETDLAYRRGAIKQLEETIFGVHNESLMDANGRELAPLKPPIRAKSLVQNTRL